MADSPLRFDPSAITQQPTRISPQEFAQQMEALTQEFVLREGAAEVDEDLGNDLNLIRAAALTGYTQVKHPTPSRPQAGPLDPAQAFRARMYEYKRMQSTLDKVDEIEKKRQLLKLYQREFPELAARLGVDESWYARLQERAFRSARGGVRALDFVLRNLDRGRASIFAYFDTKQKGGTDNDAERRALAALRGSEKGWVFYPEQQAPSFKEFLRGMGYKESIGTAVGGLVLDIAADPVNFLGVGASRKGAEIAAHQVLNAAGNLKRGEFVRKFLDDAVRAAGVADELALPITARTQVFREAGTAMRQLIATNHDTARKYLDLGGLKFAGMTLPGTAFIQQRKALRKGIIEVDLVAENVAKIIGKRTAKGIAKLGDALLAGDPGRLGQKLGDFMTMLPANLKGAGLRLGTLLSRTNPAAGKEYKWFKQSEYYDLLALEQMAVREEVRDIFRGISHIDLEDLAYAIEDNLVDQFVAKIAQTKGPDYAQLVAQAAQRYRVLMDDALINEFKRGFYGRLAAGGKKEKFARFSAKDQVDFERWVRTGDATGIEEAKLRTFMKLRKDNYVPHIYQHKAKAEKLAPPPSRPRSPSISEPFTHKRFYNSLRIAKREGLVPHTNLAEIAFIRLAAGRRAAATYDFLEETARRYGLTHATGKPVAMATIDDAGVLMPDTHWKRLLEAPEYANGRAAIDPEEMQNIALRMGAENLVPLNAVAKLDDAARKVFIATRLKLAGGAKNARRVWDKYVVGATDHGIYNGFEAAPHRDFDRAFSIANDLPLDDVYDVYKPVEVGGVFDPQILGRVVVPAPIASDLERLKGAFALPDELNYFLRLYQSTNFWWKRMVTIPFPAFHFRNKITNIVNSAMDIGLGGVLDRKTMWDVMQGVDGVLHTSAGDYSYKQIREMMRRNGVISSAYRRIDVADMLADVIEKETKGIGQLARRLELPLPGRKTIRRGEEVGPRGIAVLNPIRAGEDIGLAIENADRAQLFIKSLQRGFSPEQAARRVNRFLFDYQDISDFERKFVVLLFNPFWRWTRKNLALQSRLIFQRPGAWVTPAKFSRALSQERGSEVHSTVERELLPRHLVDTFGVRLSVAKAWSTWLLNADFPSGEINRLWMGSFSRTFRDWASQIGPQFREIMEAGMEYNFYTGQPTSRFEKGTRVYDILKAAPKPIRNYMGMREEFYRDRDWVVVDTDKWRAVNYMTAFTLSRIYSTVGRTLDPKNGSAATRIFNLLTGMRIEHVDPAEELRRIASDMVRNEENGVLPNLRRKLLALEELRRTEGLLQRDFDELLDQQVDEINTPERGVELDFEPPGASWIEQDGI